MISLSLPLAPKLKVITYHFISYRRKSVDNLVEIQNIYEGILDFNQVVYTLSDNLQGIALG